MESSVENIINDLNNQKRKLLKEIELVKNELIINLDEEYKTFDLCTHSKYETRKTTYDYPLKADKMVSESQSQHKVPRTISLANSTVKGSIDHHLKKLKTVISGTLTGTNLKYTNSIANSLKASHIGETDLMTKIKSLNTQTYITQADMSPLVQFKNIVKKRFGLFTRNRIVVMYERYFGQVSFLFLNIADIDGRVLSMNQLSGMWSFHDYFIFNKHVLIALRVRKDSYKIYLFNERLELVRLFFGCISWVEIDLNVTFFRFER